MQKNNKSSRNACGRTRQGLSTSRRPGNINNNPAGDVPWSGMPQTTFEVSWDQF